MKAVSAEEAVAMIPNGASVMVGGFMGVGTPERLLDELVRQQEIELSIIATTRQSPARASENCSTQPLSSTLTASHIGLNPKVQQQMMANKIAVNLVPQGTLVERIRAGGCGLGGVLTPTGVGTIVEEGKRRSRSTARNSCSRRRCAPQFALVHAFLADYLGNLSYALTARNFNPVMAMAADTVIVTRRAYCSRRGHRARSRRDAGTACRLPHRQRVKPWTRKPSSPDAWRSNSVPETWSISASAFRRWSPTIVPPDLKVFFQSENGLIGTGPIPEQGMAHPLLTDAGGRPISALPGASTFDSAMSFGLIRGGHVDVTVLGGLQVDAEGHLANWMIPGKMVPGMGGAMDLVSGAKRVIVAMQHAAKGKSKIVAEMRSAIDVSPAGRSRRHRHGGDRLSTAGDTLKETAPGISVAEVMAVTEADSSSRTRFRK